MTSSNRRQFLQTSLAAGATLAIPRRRLRAAGANDQVNLGIVGCGWRGGQLSELFGTLDGVEIAGLCDPDRERIDQLAEGLPKAKNWTDMRDMFDSPEIDAVAIATCNHWHALAAIWAMEAGKHVYVEKPLTHKQWEGRQVINACQKYHRICQVGLQQRSDPMQAEIKDFLHHQKALGELKSVRVNRFGLRQSIGKWPTPLNLPKSVDYNLWLGPAEDRPIYRNELHYDWHWDWNTGSGEMGNWGVHILDDVRNNVFQDEVTIPEAVVAAAGRYGWNDAGDTPNVHFALFNARGIPVEIALCNLPDQAGGEESPEVKGPDSGYIAFCAGGRLEGKRAGAKAFDSDGKLIKQFEGDGGNIHHQQNFIDAIRNNDPSILAAPASVGHHSTSWCNLANIAAMAAANSSPSIAAIAKEFRSDSVATELEQMRAIIAANTPYRTPGLFDLGPVLRFDAETEQFVGRHAELANKNLRREDRPGFVVPAISALPSATEAS